MRQTEFFCHFGSFFAFSPPPPPLQSRKSKFWKNEKSTWIFYTCFTPTYVYSKWQSYDVWFLRHENFEKIKTMPQYIIILHMCTTNGNHMMFVLEIWGMTDENLLSFWATYTPLNNLKNQNFENKNKKTPQTNKQKKPCGDIIILHKCMKNYNHMLHCSWDMACGECNFYFSFGLFFLPFYCPTNFFKIEKKNTWRYHHLT